MSARSTSKSTRLRRKRLAAGSVAVVANVPVDQFEIVDGPTKSRVLDIKDALEIIDQLEMDLYGGYPYVDQEFTLLTVASSTKFGRTLKLARIFDE